jgi:hypothetical protein
VFGNAFLQKFECAEMRAEALEAMTLIDTPGQPPPPKPLPARDPSGLRKDPHTRMISAVRGVGQAPSRPLLHVPCCTHVP